MWESIQSFFSTTDAVQTVDVAKMLVATLTSFALSMIVGYVYRVTHQGPSYSQTTVHTMVIMSIVVSLIMMIIGTNIARAFSLVGALSIIRFRNAVKESRDVAFYFLAMGVGMACGTGFGAIAIVFTLTISAIIYAMARFDVGAKPMDEVLLRMMVPESLEYRSAFDAVFYKHFSNSDLLSVDSDGSGQFELIYSVTLRRDANEQQLLADLRAVDGAVRAQLVHGHAAVGL
ncbi:MAG: DUF4956 domain-containing protein [Planctomycetes bacterium]|nr:DUF4956 domain-containing protein [Planctomycetota bacterium]